MDYIQCLGFSLPMFISLMCLVLMVMFRHRNGDPTQRRLGGIMIATYLSAVCCWLGVILYVVDYNAVVWFNTLFFLALMLDQVLLFHFIFSITGTGRGERFPRLHYIVPVALAVVMGVWSLLTPYDVQYYIIASRGEPAPGYELYSRFFQSTVPIFIVYNVIYPLLGLLRIRLYRREVVNYSADEQRSSVGWMYRLIVLIWLTLPISSGILFVHRSIFFASALTTIGAFLPIFQYLFICYNLIAGNYVIIQPPEQEEKRLRKPKRIDRGRFEAFVRERRPWLDPHLRITDLCVALHTNRSYLSSLINSEYGMNFSRYINLRRLEELDRIRLKPENANALGVEMVLEAGFSSYRSYLRAKADEDARNIVKEFE